MEIFTQAAELKSLQSQLLKKYDKMVAQREQHEREARYSVGEEDIARVVAMWTKIPVTKLAEKDQNQSSSQTEAEKLMRFVKDMIMYEPPVSWDDDGVVYVLPLEYGYEISVKMYAQLITKVPKGKITCWDDVFAFLGKLYGREVNRFPDRNLPRVDANNAPLPYWRVVSKKGILGNGMAGSSETQRKYLVDEGLEVAQRGSINGSYRVVNYKEYMFQFDNLKVVRT